MKLTIEPTGHFQTVNGVQTREWRGKTDKGTPVTCFIALVQSPRSADQTEIEDALREVKVERELVSFDLRMVSE